jgi:hypothetical protein
LIILSYLIFSYKMTVHSQCFHICGYTLCSYCLLCLIISSIKNNSSMAQNGSKSYSRKWKYKHYKQCINVHFSVYSTRSEYMIWWFYIRSHKEKKERNKGKRYREIKSIKGRRERRKVAGKKEERKGKETVTREHAYDWKIF